LIQTTVAGGLSGEALARPSCSPPATVFDSQAAAFKRRPGRPGAARRDAAPAGFLFAATLRRVVAPFRCGRSAPPAKAACDHAPPVRFTQGGNAVLHDAIEIVLTIVLWELARMFITNSDGRRRKHML